MSDTQAPVPNQVTPAPVAPAMRTLDSLVSPQFLMSLIFAGLVSFVVVKGMLGGDTTMQNNIFTLITSVASALLGFWVGSSVSSQRKDTPPPA